MLEVYGYEGCDAVDTERGFNGRPLMYADITATLHHTERLRLAPYISLTAHPIKRARMRRSEFEIPFPDLRQSTRFTCRSQPTCRSLGSTLFVCSGCGGWLPGRVPVAVDANSNRTGFADQD